MLKYTTFSYGGQFKTTANEIAKNYPDGRKETLFTPLEPYETPEAVKMLCDEFNKAIEEEVVDPLILIPLFILDFLCIHPFNDGNGTLKRLGAGRKTHYVKSFSTDLKEAVKFGWIPGQLEFTRILSSNQIENFKKLQKSILRKLPILNSKSKTSIIK